MLPALLRWLLIFGAISFVALSYPAGVDSRRKRLAITGAITAFICFAYMLTIVFDHPFSGALAIDKEGDLAICWADTTPTPISPGDAAAISPRDLEGVWASSAFGPIVVFRQIDGKILGALRLARGTVVAGVFDGVLRGTWCEAPTRRPPDDLGDVQWRRTRSGGKHARRALAPRHDRSLPRWLGSLEDRWHGTRATRRYEALRRARTLLPAAEQPEPAGERGLEPRSAEPLKRRASDGAPHAAVALIAPTTDDVSTITLPTGIQGSSPGKGQRLSVWAGAGANNRRKMRWGRSRHVILTTAGAPAGTIARCHDRSQGGRTMSDAPESPRVTRAAASAAAIAVPRPVRVVAPSGRG